MTHRRLYSTALLVGTGFGIVLLAWKLAAGTGSLIALGWALGGLAATIVLAVLADIGMRLQRRDIPSPRTFDAADERQEGRLDDE